ncbi:MAG: diguanylate cyclase [Rhodoferax sp.]|nr:diguanylate cyclase [Rhodoferax sp.]
MSESGVRRDRHGRVGGLQARLLLIIVVGAVLFALAAGALAYQLGHQRAIANSRATLLGLAQAVEKTLAIGTFAADVVLVREVVDGLARNPLIASVQVRTTDGKTLWQHPRADGAEEALALDASDRLELVQPLFSPFDEKERLGELLIHANALRVTAAANREALTLAAMMIGQVALVALLLYGVTALLVSRPIIRLARQLHDMPPGTTQRLDTPARHRNDEIGTLIVGANALLDANAVALRRERELRSEIEAMEAQYRHIFDSSSAGIFVLDEEGHLINSNPTVSKVVGMSLASMKDLTRDNFIERVFGQPAQVRAMMEESARTGDTVSGDLELVQRGDGRRWVHCLISVHTAAGISEPAARAVTTEGVMYDVTERKTAETAVRYQAEHDALTGLRNRAASHATIDRFISEGRAGGSPVSLLCIDLDGFKQINDRHGHDAGDQVLVACAQRMKSAVRRSTDLVGRLGGDEFVVALRDVGTADTALVAAADNLLAGLCAPITLSSGLQVQVGASIGIACAPHHGEDREALLEMADAGMYEVKRTGKNNYAMGLPSPPAQGEGS